MNKDSVNKDSIKTDSINIEFKPMTSEYNPINTNENDENEYVQVYVSELAQNSDPGEWNTFGGWLVA